MSEPYLNAIPAREALKKRLTELWNYEQYGYNWLDDKSRMPVRKGGRYFYVEKAGSQNQGILYWAAALDAPPQVLVDPNTLSADATASLADYSISHRRTLRGLRRVGRRHGLGHLARARGRNRPRPAGPHRRHQVHGRVLAAGLERLLLLPLPEGRRTARATTSSRSASTGTCSARRRRTTCSSTRSPTIRATIRTASSPRTAAGWSSTSPTASTATRSTCATSRSPTPRSSACSTSGTASTTSSARWTASSISAPPRARRAAA